jgi:murein DD-endopeptidase MepM/ murein hydrolase activator NlpD
VVTSETTPSRARRARRSGRLAVLGLVAAPLLLGGGPVGLTVPAARGETLEQARAREEAAHAALEGSTAAVQAAGAELARVEAELPGAQAAVAAAKGELAGARAKATAARAAAERAEAARDAAQEEVDDATAQVEKTRDDVDRLARRAYQRGRLGDLREVMEATEPQDALARGEMLRSVFRSGTASLDRVTTSRLLLAGKTAQLAEEEQAAAQAREAAAAQQSRAEQAAAQAQAAADHVAALIADRASALGTAQSLREQDRRAYEQAQADSRALAERIRRAEAERARREAAARAEAQRRAAAAAARAGRPAPPPPAAAPAPSRNGWQWPGRGRLTSRYGWRTHPVYGDRRFHAGIDIGGGYGAPILATKAGEVIYAGPASGYGNLVVVSHGGGISSAYGHMSSIAVNEGQSVSQGQRLGAIGSLGTSTGPHLHFEIRVGGDPVDPLGYVSPP